MIYPNNRLVLKIYLHIFIFLYITKSLINVRSFLSSPWGRDVVTPPYDGDTHQLDRS